MPACLVIAGLLVYGNSLHGVFLFDDHNSVEGNVHVRSLWPLTSAMTAPANTPLAGRPVSSLSLALNYAAHGLDVEGYHVVNIAIHVLASLVLFGIVRRTLGFPWIAFATALIWLVHPLQTEAVNYITQRTESLAGLFYLLTLYCAIRAKRGRESFLEDSRAESRLAARLSSRNDSRPLFWDVAAVVCCALGMASKEVVVTAPVMVVLYDLVFRREPIRELVRARGALYTGLASTWIVLAALTSGPRAGTVGFDTGIDPLIYLMNQCLMVPHYLRLAVWPRPLVLDYGPPSSVAFGEALPGMILLIVLVGASVAALVRRHPIGFAGAWFFGILAPTSSLVPIATEVGAERRMYLPLAALIVLAAIAVARMRSRRGALALMLGVAAVFGATSAARNLEYRDEASMWRTVVAARPHWRAHSNLGQALMKAGDFDGAIAQSREALRLNPAAAEASYNLAEAHNSRGIAFAREGNQTEADIQYRAALRVNPKHAAAHANLGDVLLAQGRFAEAADQYRLYLATGPALAAVHNNLGMALASQERVAEAAGEFERALQLDPAHDNARRNLARARALLGEVRP